MSRPANRAGIPGTARVAPEQDAGVSGHASPRGSLRAVALMLALLALGYGFRLLFATSVLPPPARMQGETTQAYRYARMVSMGEEIPQIDRRVMHPDGLNTGENSIFEEYVAGYLHTILPTVDFDSWMRFFTLFFPLLVMPALYIWMRNSGFDRTTSMIAAGCYAVILPAVLRARGGSLYRETVALPLIAATAASIEGWRALSGRKSSVRGLIRLGVSILLFLSALACWKVTQYFAVLLFAYLLLENTGAGRKTARPSQLPVVALVLTYWLACLVIPHMRHDGAIAGPASVAGLFAVVSLRVRSRWILAVAFASVLVVFTLLPASGSSGHVGGVLAARLRFPFAHPADPLQLSPDARLFWVSGYTGPSLQDILLLFGIPLILTAPGLGRFFRRTGTDVAGSRLMQVFLLAGLLGFLLFERLHVLLALTLCPVLALSARRNRVLTILVPAVLVLQSLGVGSIAQALRSVGVTERGRESLLTDRELDDLISWVELETTSDEAILSYWHISGLLSAYADRPVVTHTFFESERNRRTIQEFARTMFMDEEQLVELCRERQCELVVHQADFLLDDTHEGLLYLAGYADGRAPAGCVALRMQYAPESLDSFRLVFEGSSLRMYSIGGHASRLPSSSTHLLFRPDLASLLPEYGEGLSVVIGDPVGTAVGMARDGRSLGDYTLLSASLCLMTSEPGADPDAAIAVLQEIVSLYIGRSSPMGIDELARDFRSYLVAFGPDPMLRRDLALLLSRAGRTEEAIAEYRAVLSEAPDYIQARNELNALLSDTEEEGSSDGS